MSYRLEMIRTGEVIASFTEDEMLWGGMDGVRAHPGSRLVSEDGTVIATHGFVRSATRPFILRTLDSRIN